MSHPGPVHYINDHPAGPSTPGNALPLGIPSEGSARTGKRPVGRPKRPLSHLFLQHLFSPGSTLPVRLFLLDCYDPFLDCLDPIPNQQPGLMHALIYLGASDLMTNVGGPASNPSSVVEQIIHHDLAIRMLRRDIQTTLDASNPPTSNSNIMQALVLCLQTVCAGDSSKTHRTHLDGMKSLINMTTLSISRPRSYVFIAEFIVYSDCCSSFTTVTNPFDASLNDLHASVRSWSLTFGYCGNFFGVLDGTFDYLPRIRALRDRTRLARAAGQFSSTDSEIVAETKAIECALQSWTSPFLPISSRNLVACLYRHCMLVYLYRTAYPSCASPLFTTMVDEGLQNFCSVPFEMLPVMLLPLFILGCTAWEPAQRQDILAGLGKVQSWSRLKNVGHTRELLEEFWVKMDRGDEGVSWDWEAIAAGRNTLVV